MVKVRVRARSAAIHAGALPAALALRFGHLASAAPVLPPDPVARAVLLLLLSLWNTACA